MILAEKGNRVIQISEDSIQRYSEQGYRIVNELGAVLVDTVPTDLPTLTLAYKKSMEQIKTLQTELDNANAEIASLKTQLNAKSETKTETVKVKKAKAE